MTPDRPRGVQEFFVFWGTPLPRLHVKRGGMERQLDEMVDGGLITLKKAHVILYRSEQSARK